MIETLAKPAQSAAESTTQPRWFQKRRLWIFVATLCLMAPIAVMACHIYLTDHFHPVIPGRVYRGAHPSLEELTEMKAKYGIRTVVNLRGDNPWLGWHKVQSEHLKKIGVHFESLSISAERLPFATEIQQLLDVFDNADHPIFIHCYRGIDRTGLASMIYLLAKTDTPLEYARRHLSWRYGHLPIGKPARLAHFLGDYESWLAKKAARHSRDRFRHWIKNEYQANWSCDPLQFDGPQPKYLATDEPTTFRIRTRNTGKKTWPLRPTRTAGIHLWYQLVNLDKYAVIEGRAGLLHRDVAGGESVVFTVVVPPVRGPGRYILRADLIDEREGPFYVIGSPLLEREIVARENVRANRD